MPHVVSMQYQRLLRICKLISNNFEKELMNCVCRKTFAKNSVKYLRDNKFDGLDLDWVKRISLLCVD